MARKTIDATEKPVGVRAAGVVNMAVTGPAELEHPDITIIDGPQWKDLAEELAFNEELVTVMVMKSSDKYAEPVVPVWVNGRVQHFIRGQAVTVKRKFVERLARAQTTSFGNEEFITNDGDKSIRWPKNISLSYPFTVIRDDNPKGADWLTKILAEGS